MKQTDEGIFLHRTSFSDSSLIITFYTRNSGLRKFVFKGGKKKAHQLFPLAVSELTYYGRQESDLLQLTSCEGVLPLDFQFDPVKSTIAFFIAECIRKSVHEYDSDNNVFDFLKESIVRLNSEEHRISMFPITFLIEFAELLGIQPLVEGNAQIFDLDEGTISDYAHPGHRSSKGEHIALISLLIQGKSLEVSKAVREEALKTLMEYYLIHIPRLNQFETYAIVKEILS